MTLTVVKTCAGIDVHKKQITVCILSSSEFYREPKRKDRIFGTTTNQLRLCKQWLVKLGVERIIMESTGQYWRPVWNILSDDRWSMHLVNPQHIRNSKGHKTDRNDANLLAYRGRMGDVRPSFVPKEATQELRALTRHRETVKQEITQRKNRIHDILQRSNIKLSSFISDIFGKTGQALLRLLANGEVINEETVSANMYGNIQATPNQLVEALDGCIGFADRFLLDENLNTLNRLNEEVKSLNSFIEKQLSKDEDLYLRLQEIPGIGESIAQTIIAEIGDNVDTFPTSGHLASWAGVCPGNYESAGISKSAKTTKGNRHLRLALHRAALAAAHSKDPILSQYYKKFVHRGEKAKGITAIAHKILRSIYHMVKKNESYNPYVRAS